MGVGNCGWDLLWVWVTVGVGTGVWVTVSVGNFGFWVVMAGSGVVPKPRNKLLVSQGFLIVAPRFYAALHYINLFVLYTFMSCCLCSLRGGWP